MLDNYKSRNNNGNDRTIKCNLDENNTRDFQLSVGRGLMDMSDQVPSVCRRSMGPTVDGKSQVEVITELNAIRWWLAGHLRFFSCVIDSSCLLSIVIYVLGEILFFGSQGCALVSSGAAFTFLWNCCNRRCKEDSFFVFQSLNPAYIVKLLSFTDILVVSLSVFFTFWNTIYKKTAAYTGRFMHVFYVFDILLVEAILIEKSKALGWLEKLWNY